METLRGSLSISPRGGGWGGGGGGGVHAEHTLTESCHERVGAKNVRKISRRKAINVLSAATAAASDLVLLMSMETRAGHFIWSSRAQLWYQR